MKRSLILIAGLFCCVFNGFATQKKSYQDCAQSFWEFIDHQEGALNYKKADLFLQHALYDYSPQSDKGSRQEVLSWLQYYKDGEHECEHLEERFNNIWWDKDQPVSDVIECVDEKRKINKELVDLYYEQKYCFYDPMEKAFQGNSFESEQAQKLYQHLQEKHSKLEAKIKAIENGTEKRVAVGKKSKRKALAKSNYWRLAKNVEIKKINRAQLERIVRALLKIKKK